MLLELACLSYFVIRVVQGSLFSPDRWKYWKDPKNPMIIILVVVRWQQCRDRARYSSSLCSHLVAAYVARYVFVHHSVQHLL